MNYKVAHTSTYTYGKPVGVCHNQVLLAPRDDARVHCDSYYLAIRPAPIISSQRIDFFGNRVHAFSIEEPHSELAIDSSCVVKVAPPLPLEPETTLAWEKVVRSIAEQQAPDWLEAWPLSCDSPRVARGKLFRNYAADLFSPGRPVVQALVDLTARIHADFEYDNEATDVCTSPREAYRLKKGVCQDFAHVQIACLRSLGLPAHYVSGYLRTVRLSDEEESDDLVGADESHAWVAAYCGPAGWVEVDPTNNVLVAIDHIPLAFGRDYHDVAPIRGVFLGGGVHKLEVSVDVVPIQDEGSTLDRR